MDQNFTFIGIGSNLDQPLEQITKAVQEINRSIASQPCRVAKIVKTPPLGGPPQNEYYNTVVQLTCLKHPEQILKICQDIEASHGRTRDVHWGPRTLDLDLLYHQHQCIQSDQLTLPHPGMTEREFVLLPLFTLSPCLINPLTDDYYAMDLKTLYQNKSTTLLAS